MLSLKQSTNYVNIFFGSPGKVQVWAEDLSGGTPVELNGVPLQPLGEQLKSGIDNCTPPPPRPAASNTSSGIFLRCYSPRNPLGSSTVHWMAAPLWPSALCLHVLPVFTFPTPGMLCRCGPRPTHPPYRHGAKQIPCLGNKGEYLELQSVDTTSAAHALPVQTDVVRILDGSGFHFLLRSRPRIEGTTLPRKLCAGAETAEMRWRTHCPWR